MESRTVPQRYTHRFLIKRLCHDLGGDYPHPQEVADETKIPFEFVVMDMNYFGYLDDEFQEPVDMVLD